MDFFDIFLSLLALILLEIILGIDNLIFLSILTNRLPKEEQKSARFWGLSLAWIMRLVLLFSAVWLVKLTQPIFTYGEFSLSIRSIFLFAGGTFLIVKATQEIHQEVSRSATTKNLYPKIKTFKGVLFQIVFIDLVLSLDSVLTAIGLTKQFWIMAIAITFSILAMLLASKTVSLFINKNPSIKILALNFLILIGTLLIADSFSFHVPRGYLYFAMGFALMTELLNLLQRSRKRKRSKKSIKDTTP